MAKKTVKGRPGRRSAPGDRRMTMWLSDNMARRLAAHAAYLRTDTGSVVEEALAVHLNGSRYQDRSRGPVGSGGPGGQDPSSLAVRLPELAPAAPEGQDQAAA